MMSGFMELVILWLKLTEQGDIYKIEGSVCKGIEVWYVLEIAKVWLSFR